MADNDSGMAFVSGFLLGGLVGAVVGLLLAPKSGAETRAGIAEHGDVWRHRAEDFAAADAIRDQLAEQGVELLDGREGTRWRQRAGR